ncbi:MAG TPA: hypothetical protein VEW69_01770, partial [Alphaproteobacteria bacterium]|nr:hypothetical protein [Alphaproteobacteria bacterium]
MRSMLLKTLAFSCRMLIFAGLSRGILLAQPWHAVGPDGGTVRSLALDPANPERIFLGTSAGTLYLSNDS